MSTFFRGAALLAQFRAVRPPAILPAATASAPPETAEYIDARTEAAANCRALGLDVTNDHWACEVRLSSPDMADTIFQAMHNPETVLPRNNVSESQPRWAVRAVQQAITYGIPTRAD